MNAAQRFFGLVLTLIILAPFALTAQSGMEFADFKRKLEPYFADDLIEDLRMAMPQGANYRVWGWDVGDFSGDGVLDVAFSVNVLGTRRRESTVYLFVDNEGFLVNIARYPLAYVELPLEIGVVIRDGACFVTQKKKAEHWSIRGYQYRDGAVVLFDEFVSDRVDVYGHESYRNFRTLETRERFLNAKGDEQFRSNYITIPCYQRGRQIVAGYVSDVVVDAIRNVHAGAYWWKGPEDASFTARVVYDDEYLYLRVNVMDSTVVTGWCDTCAADRLDIWLDAVPPDERSGSRTVGMDDKGRVRFRTESDSGLYAFSIRIGDFTDVRPSIKVKTTDDLTPDQEAAIQQLRVVTALRSDGYVVKLRIPFLLLGYERVPLEERSLTELGCSIALYDVDNEFRPEESTLVATSPIDVLNPATYGSIRFIPESLWYGETMNIYTDAVMMTLQELGF